MPSKEYRILFVGENCGFVGGIERYMHQAAQMLSEINCKTDLLTFKEAWGSADFAAAFSRVLSLDELRADALRYDLLVVHKIRSAEILRELKARYFTAVFIHDHECYCPRRAYYLPFTRINCQRAYSRLRCSVCGMLRKPGRHPLDEWRQIAVDFPSLWNEIKTSQALIVLSEFMRGNLERQKVPADKILRIPPFIPVESQDGVQCDESPEGVPLLLSVGQLIRGKGVDQLLSALHFVKNDFRLEILGDGNDADWLKELAKPFGDKVVFKGWVRKPEEYYAKARALVLPWRWQEPFGLVGAEALAQGCPLIGFDVGGIREYLIQNETGVLVPPGDINGLAEAIDMLLVNRDLSKKFGQSGRRHVATAFTQTAYLYGWKSLLEKALHARC